MKNTRPHFRKSPPEGVVELVDAIGVSKGLVALEDGSLFAPARTEYRISQDGGHSWSDPKPFPEGAGGTSALRLQSGSIAMACGSQVVRTMELDQQLWVSHDEAQTWEHHGKVLLFGSPHVKVLIQLKDGRLVFPSRLGLGYYHHPELLPENVRSYGMWRGLRTRMGGHYHYPEIDIAAVSYSDDEGRSWELCTDYGEGALMGWFDEQGTPNGRGGVTSVDEPSVAETKDGRLLLFGRSTVGRIVYSYSHDRGQTWSAVRPADLAASYSPPYLIQIPKTGDLLCVWNQVSRQEIRLGQKRCRLSVALSEDCGLSWKNFKTIEVSAGLAEVDRIEPEYPTTSVIAEPHLGVIPDDFAVFHYPTVSFVDDKVYLIYNRLWLAEGEQDAGARFESADNVEYGSERVLRIYPLEYFYA